VAQGFDNTITIAAPTDNLLKISCLLVPAIHSPAPAEGEGSDRDQILTQIRLYDPRVTVSTERIVCILSTHRQPYLALCSELSERFPQATIALLFWAEYGEIYGYFIWNDGVVVSQHHSMGTVDYRSYIDKVEKTLRAAERGYREYI